MNDETESARRAGLFGDGQHGGLGAESIRGKRLLSRAHSSAVDEVRQRARLLSGLRKSVFNHRFRHRGVR